MSNKELYSVYFASERIMGNVRELNSSTNVMETKSRWDWVYLSMQAWRYTLIDTCSIKTEQLTIMSLLLWTTTTTTPWDCYRFGGAAD